MADLYTL